MLHASILSGLPPYGPPADAYPPEWGRLGREGTVVRVEAPGVHRVFNLGPGGMSITTIVTIPGAAIVLAISRGAAYVIHGPPAFRIEELGVAITGVLSLGAVEPILLEDRYTSFIGLFADGRWWRTRRLSWDGFSDVRLSGSTLAGFALDPTDPQEQPKAFRVDIRSGRSVGGSFSAADPSVDERLLPVAS